MDKKLKKYIQDNKEFVKKIILNLWGTYAVKKLYNPQSTSVNRKNITHDQRRIDKALDVLYEYGYIRSAYSDVTVNEEAFLKHAPKKAKHSPFDIKKPWGTRNGNLVLKDYYKSLSVLSKEEQIYIYFHQNEFLFEEDNIRILVLPKNQLKETKEKNLIDLSKKVFDKAKILSIAYNIDLKILYKEPDYGSNKIEDYRPSRLGKAIEENIIKDIKEDKSEIKKSIKYFEMCSKEMKTLEEKVAQDGENYWKLFLENFKIEAPLYIHSKNTSLKYMTELALKE